MFYFLQTGTKPQQGTAPKPKPEPKKPKQRETEPTEPGTPTLLETLSAMGDAYPDDSAKPREFLWLSLPYHPIRANMGVTTAIKQLCSRPDMQHLFAVSFFGTPEYSKVLKVAWKNSLPQTLSIFRSPWLEAGDGGGPQ